MPSLHTVDILIVARRPGVAVSLDHITLGSILLAVCCWFATVTAQGSPILAALGSLAGVQCVCSLFFQVVVCWSVGFCRLLCCSILFSTSVGVACL